MAIVFISGSMDIKNIHREVVSEVDNIIASQFEVIIGDADGVDTLIQTILNSPKYENVTVYCSGQCIRNNIGNWPTQEVLTKEKNNTRLFYTAKDLAMSLKCTYGLMIWNSRSTGTLNNVIELLKQNKESSIFINKIEKFLKVTNVSDLEKLISIMSADDLNRADKKIQLRKKINELKQINFL